MILNQNFKTYRDLEQQPPFLYNSSARRFRSREPKHGARAKEAVYGATQKGDVYLCPDVSDHK